MSTYSEDLERIRIICNETIEGAIDRWDGLSKLQKIAIDLAEEKFKLTMELAMRNNKELATSVSAVREYKPGWTARNSEEWGETEA